MRIEISLTTSIMVKFTYLHYGRQLNSFDFLLKKYLAIKTTWLINMFIQFDLDVINKDIFY